MISSLTLLRRQVLAFALHPGIREQVLDAYKVLELAHRTMLFFDRAIYHMARGYANGDV